MQPLIYGSAFALNSLTTWSGAQTASAVSPYASTFPADFTGYYGAETVSNEHTMFPPQGSGAVSPYSTSASLQNMNAFSLHTYGKQGYAIWQLGNFTMYSINASRVPPVNVALPYAVTEHAAHTTASWNGYATTADTYYEASRLGAQLLWNAIGALTTPSPLGAAQRGGLVLFVLAAVFFEEVSH